MAADGTVAFSWQLAPFVPLVWPRIVAIQADPNGGLALIGFMREPDSYDDPPPELRLPGRVVTGFTKGTAQQGNTFVAKLDANGQHVWSTVMRRGSSDALTAVAVSSTSDVYVSGVACAMNLGAGRIDASSQREGICEGVILAKLAASDGHPLWTKAVRGEYWGSHRYSAVDQLVVGADDAIIMSGRYEGESPDFGGGPLPYDRGQTVPYVASYASDGTYRDSHGYTEIDRGFHHGGNGWLAVGPSGQRFLSIPRSTPEPGANDFSTTIAVMAPNGALERTLTFAGDRPVHTSGLAARGDGKLVVGIAYANTSALTVGAQYAASLTTLAP